jgi:hypothetical protein
MGTKHLIVHGGSITHNVSQFGNPSNFGRMAALIGWLHHVGGCFDQCRQFDDLVLGQGLDGGNIIKYASPGQEKAQLLARTGSCTNKCVSVLKSRLTRWLPLDGYIIVVSCGAFRQIESNMSLLGNMQPEVWPREA